MARGTVALVGAGPGHPGLITLRAVELLRQADAIVYDRLAAPELLSHAAPTAELVYVGKRAGQHALSQEGINALLVKLGLEGKRVVRLKGGDPFVFGRGGEEALALADAEVEFEIVPGVTSAIAAPAFAGIPVTHRENASSVAIVTGHEDPTKPVSAHRWERLAHAADTLVILMGVERLAELADTLVRHGRSSAEPAAVVESGTLPRQRMVVGTLASIAQLAHEASISPPAILVVGEVVRLHERLSWFRPGPLAGARVLVTRARDQASRLSRLLAERGAEPVEFPAIEIARLDDPAPLDQAIERLEGYDWVVFTSANGVTALFQRIDALGLDTRRFATARVCAIGTATADALRERGLRADWMPDEFLTTAIVEGFAKRSIAGQRFLLPRADIADPELATGLRHLGADVDDVTAYRTLPVTAQPGPALTLLERGEIDVVTFASSSTVRNLCEALGDRLSLLAHSAIVCIGPVTAATAREHGLTVRAVAAIHTIDGLVDAVTQVVGSAAAAAPAGRSPA